MPRPCAVAVGVQRASMPDAPPSPSMADVPISVDFTLPDRVLKHNAVMAVLAPPPLMPQNLEEFKTDASTPELLMQQRILEELRQLKVSVKHANDTMLAKIQSDLYETRDSIRIALRTSTKRGGFKEGASFGLHEEHDQATHFGTRDAEHRVLMDLDSGVLVHDAVGLGPPSPAEITDNAVESDQRAAARAGLAVESSNLDELGQVPVQSMPDISPDTPGHDGQRLAHLLSSDEGREEKALPAWASFVESSKFEILSMVFILGNTFLMALEAEVRGVGLGNRMGYDTYSISWPWAHDAFIAGSAFFLVIFAIELFLRLAVLKIVACYSVWIWLDFFLVTFGLLDLLITIRVGDGVAVNPSMLRMLRLLRLMRLVKALKVGQGRFHTLFLIVKSIRSSCTALFWSITLFVVMCLSVGMLLNQFTASYLEQEGNDVQYRREVFAYFGTFTRTMLTMFEITLGNWAPPSRLLTDHVSELWGVFIVVYRNVFCFSVINVIRAVFIMETSRVASGDDEVALMNKDRTHSKHQQKFHGFFQVLDNDGDGALTWSEFSKALSDEKVVNYMSTLELEGEAHNLFQLLATNHGDIDEPRVNCRHFVQHVHKLTGNAKASDMKMVLHQIKEIQKQLGR